MIISALVSVGVLFNLLSANITKWSNTLKQFVVKLPTNYLSVFDHFVGLALKGLSWIWSLNWALEIIEVSFYTLLLEAKFCKKTNLGFHENSRASYKLSLLNAWKVPVFGVFLDRIFPNLDRIRVETDLSVRLWTHFT